MKSHKYPTLHEALTDLQSKGQLTFRGSEGYDDIYTLDLNGARYILLVSKEGNVRMLYEINPWRGE